MNLKSMMLKLTTKEGLIETGIEGLDIYRLSHPYDRWNRRSKRLPKSPILTLPADLKSIVIGNGFIKDPLDYQL